MGEVIDMYAYRLRKSMRNFSGVSSDTIVYDDVDEVPAYFFLTNNSSNYKFIFKQTEEGDEDA